MNPFIFILTISLLFSSIGQGASDLYLPSLPAIATSLNATVSMVQATLFWYMVGYSFSRLIYGPLSDAFGRKKPLIVGLLVCLLGTIICVFANSVTILIIGRFLQGFGAGAGVVISGAIVRDKLEGAGLAKVFSYIGMANIILVAIAPVLGGYLQHHFGWRSGFIFLSVYILVALLVGGLFLHETNRYQTLEHLRPRVMWSNFVELIKNRNCMIYTTCIFVVFAGLLAWLTAGPILLQNQVGVTPVGFGWTVMAVGFCYAVGAFSNGKLVSRFGMDKMLKVGILLLIMGGMVMFGFGIFRILNFWVVVIPVIIFMIGSSWIIPNAYAGALIPFARFAGFAGAIIGFIQVAGGSLASGLIAILPDHNQIPLALTLLFCGLISLSAYSKLK